MSLIVSLSETLSIPVSSTVSDFFVSFLTAGFLVVVFFAVVVDFVLVEEALVDALNSGKLSGAAIDVLTREPMLENCPLLNAKNITITPHIAWAPLQTRVRLLSIVTSNVKAFIEGNPTNVVN